MTAGEDPGPGGTSRTPLRAGSGAGTAAGAAGGTRRSPGGAGEPAVSTRGSGVSRCPARDGTGGCGNEPPPALLQGLEGAGGHCAGLGGHCDNLSGHRASSIQEPQHPPAPEKAQRHGGPRVARGQPGRWEFISIQIQAGCRRKIGGFLSQGVPGSLLCLEQPQGGLGLVVNTVAMVALLEQGTKRENPSGKPSRDGTSLAERPWSEDQGREGTGEHRCKPGSQPGLHSALHSWNIAPAGIFHGPAEHGAPTASRGLNRKQQKKKR